MHTRMSNDSEAMRWIWSLAASAAGAITALSFQPYQNMSLGKILMSLFVGTAFAFFVGPWVAFLVFGNGPVDIRLLGALFYVMASGSNVLIPLAIRKISGILGTEQVK